VQVLPTTLYSAELYGHYLRVIYTKEVGSTHRKFQRQILPII